MKKIILIASAFLTPVIVNAEVYQLPDGKTISGNLVNIPAMILVLYLVSVFILTMIKSFQDFRLKSKMVEKGVTDKVAEQYLHTDHKDTKSQAIKWFLVLAGIGLGLSIIDLTLPLGIHSVAIMAFSISLSFLGYYFFIRRTDK